jgi:hypothetical protein
LGYIEEEKWTLNILNNAGIGKIQTVNVIQDIIGNEDLYHGAFGHDSKPTYIPEGIEYLILDNGYGTSIEYVVNYIKNTGTIVTLNQIKEAYTNMYHAQSASVDISYNNKKAYEITTLDIGTILRCSVKKATSYSIGYLYFNGSIPNTVRVPKILSSYVGSSP